jgi:type VII secretion protein EccB
MATKKDLVEAYAFSRRRLVTAFVSGAPGGREVEPARPGRTVVAGVALAVLLLAGAAIAGVFSDRADEGWQDQAGLVVDKDSGALYVVLGDDGIPGSDEPTLRSVVNVTSAQLILGTENAAAQSVPGSDIAATRKGPPIGILEAPATVPPADDLIDDDWTACTASGAGVRLAVSGAADATEDPQAAFVVASGGHRYLLAPAPDAGPQVPATARAYRLPADADALTTALGVHGTVVRVPAAWVALFDTGGALDSDGLGVADPGSPVSGSVASAVPRGTRIGDWYETDDDRRFVVTADGAAELDEFAFDVLTSSRLDGYRPHQVRGEVDTETIPYAATPPWARSHWPVGALENPVSDGDQVCTVLHTAPGAPPTVSLAVDPGAEASADGTGPGSVDVDVESGHGAVVEDGDWSAEAGLPTLVDDRGMKYALRGEEAVHNLGYDGVDRVVVPDGWMELFRPGPELSRDAALCPPSNDPDPACG